MKLRCPTFRRPLFAVGQRPNLANSTAGNASDENLIKHLKPLYLVSKLFSLNPFKLIYGSNKGAQISVLGIVQSIAVCVLYGAFHLYANLSDGFDKGGPGNVTTRNATNVTEQAGDKKEQNFVSVMIDMYNRYSGLGLYWMLVLGAVANQRILIRCIDSFRQVDAIFETKLKIVVRNSRWIRLICIQMMLIFAFIIVFEYSNCIVYLSDYSPTSEFCLPDCYFFLLTSVTAESQIVGYIKLLQMRFQLINQLLVRFNELDSPSAVKGVATSLSSSSQLVPLASEIYPPPSYDTKLEVNELELNHHRLGAGGNAGVKLPHHHNLQLILSHSTANNAFVKEMVPEREMRRLFAPTQAQIDLQYYFRRSERPCRRIPKTKHWGKRAGMIRQFAAMRLNNPQTRNVEKNPVNNLIPGKHLSNAENPSIMARLFRRIGTIHPTNPLETTWASPSTGVVLQHQQLIAVSKTSPQGEQNRPTQSPVGLIKPDSEAWNHTRMDIINDIKNLYAHLHLLSLNINKAYGVQLIFILMTLFISLTTLMYHCTMKAIRLLLQQPSSREDLYASWFEVGSTFYWAMVSAIRMFRICNICNSTKNEVKLFSLQLLQQKVEFTACGLFNIDHGLLFNIAGAVTTYILILLQFDVAQNRSQWQRAEQ